VYITALAFTPGHARLGQAASRTEADALFLKREDPAAARQAAELWTGILRSNPRDFEAAWKLARAGYWLGDHAPEAQRGRQYEMGMEAAWAAIAVEPRRPEGYFWLGSNMGGRAEVSTLAAIRYRKPIREQFEKVIELEPGFAGGAGFTALGAWYYDVPGIAGGDKRKAEDLLRRALTYGPNATDAHFYLALTLIALGRRQEARAELQKVLDAPLDPEYAPEDRECKQKAKALLGNLGSSSARNSG
jgi:tetratricopeptide (TPR) repeat protein